MADTTSLENFLNDVADSIRAKTGGTEEILAKNFDIEISNIDTVNNQSKTTTPAITEVVVEPDEGYTGLSLVTISAVDNTIDSNIAAENIKSNVTILGVTGTLEEGIDTSDATATSSDILSEKTAYVNGEKVSGTINTTEGMNIMDSTGTLIDIYDTEGSSYCGLATKQIQDVYLEPDSEVSLFVQKSKMANTIGLTADKIVEGNTILNIEGTAIESNETSLSVTENGTYTPDEGYTGFNEITVNVDGGSSKLSVSGAGLFANFVYAQYYNYTSQSSITVTSSMLPYFSNINDYFEPFNDASYMFYTYNGINSTYWGGLTDDTFDISHINFKNLTNMSHMFAFGGVSWYTAYKYINFGDIDTSLVTNMDAMFYNNTYLVSLDLSVFDTSSVTSMQYMFYYCSGLTSLDLSNFDTSNVITMYGMFYQCRKLIELDLSNFDTTNVTSMQSMFSDCVALTSLDVSGFDTNNVVSMYTMFYNCKALTELDLSSFSGTTSTTSTSQDGIVVHNMFYNCTLLQTLDISGLDWRCTSSSVFNKCTALETVYVKDEDSKTACDTALAAAGLSITSTIKE